MKNFDSLSYLLWFQWETHFDWIYLHSQKFYFLAWLRNWCLYIYYKAQILPKINDRVSTHVSLWHCVTQNQYIVQIYYHSDVDFFWEEIGIFDDFVNIRGAVTSPKHRHITRSESSSTESLQTSSKFDQIGHLIMHSSGPFCTSNLLSILSEKGLPFGNGEKERSSLMFLDWLQNDSLHLLSH